VSLAHAAALERGNAKYPIERVECKTFSVATGSRSIHQQNVFQGQLPSRIIIACVDHDAYNGTYAKNPFNFKNNKITKLSLQVDSQDKPLNPIVCNFTDGMIAEAYMNLMTGARKAFKDEDVDVSREDFSQGYALFCFDLTPDLGESDHFSLVRSGSVRLAIEFGDELARTINIIVYGEFQNVLEIDRNRNVFFDFTA
jgi:hypothetical protein